MRYKYKYISEKILYFKPFKMFSKTPKDLLLMVRFKMDNNIELVNTVNSIYNRDIADVWPSFIHLSVAHFPFKENELKNEQRQKIAEKIKKISNKNYKVQTTTTEQFGKFLVSNLNQCLLLTDLESLVETLKNDFPKIKSCIKNPHITIRKYGGNEKMETKSINVELSFEAIEVVCAGSKFYDNINGHNIRRRLVSCSVNNWKPYIRYCNSFCKKPNKQYKKSYNKQKNFNRNWRK